MTVSAEHAQINLYRFAFLYFNIVLFVTLLLGLTFLARLYRIYMYMKKGAYFKVNQDIRYSIPQVFFLCVAKIVNFSLIIMN